jgi:CRISPR-associated protein Cmr6
VVTDESGRPEFRPKDVGQLDGGGTRPPAERANARLILHRTAVLKVRTDDTGAQHIGDLDDTPIRIWAIRTDLGQRHQAKLRAALAQRRAAALADLAAATGMERRTIRVEPQGALITGTATGGIRDVGIELDGTYGWPVLPASTLKGVTHAKAVETGTAVAQAHLFGFPRPAKPASSEDSTDDETAQESRGESGGSNQPQTAPGSVWFFDALPGPDGVTVAEHVLTPHTRDYRTGRTDSRGKRLPPAEYVNPVPIPFLVVETGTFTVHLLGPAQDVTAAAELLSAAVNDLGVGAKTSAGYGYLTAHDEPPS